MDEIQKAVEDEVRHFEAEECRHFGSLANVGRRDRSFEPP